MAETNRMSLTEAKTAARELVEAMRPFCDRIEVAGSTRREKAGGIKDIEIVAVPKWVERPDADAPAFTLFEEAPQMVRVNLLHEWAMQQSKPGPVGVPRDGVCWIKASKPNETEAWVKAVPDTNGRYWRGLLTNGCTLDLFLTEPSRWGATFLVRTGEAKFSEEIVTRAKAGRRYRFGKGGLCEWFADNEDKTANLVATPEERDVFALLGLAFVPPIERTGPHAVRRLERPIR